ncbi:protein PUTATIVE RECOMBINATION INITIATION DEFECT 1-like [Rutidosis leptorrhynchoides]|uniref:protein PUTATIVE RECOMBINATION INITIATION DEFECT 1-like n=1 Tax=Rutidosis leptorrhynchoides TaxID=125765 RepID=UPI003A99D261
MYYSGADHPQRSDSDQHLRHQQYLTCSQGHTSSLILQTLEGGSICLVCLSNLISNPNSPTVHVSYALSQLSHAISQPQFSHNLFTFHPHFLVSPLVTAISSFDDEPLAKQMIDLINQLCKSGEFSVYGEFVARVSDQLCSGSLSWSRRQVYMLHCLGILLDSQQNDSYTYIKDKDALYLNLVSGLQLPSEEIQGEILFVLYKIWSTQYDFAGSRKGDVMCGHSLKILRLSLEALLKTHRDDVRMNCVALLSVLARRGFFEAALENDVTKDYAEADNFMETTDQELEKTPLNVLFAEAIKGPLLSSDCEVQTATLDLVVQYMSCGGVSQKEVQALVEENIADYVFEILRLYGCKKVSVVISSLQVLDLLSVAEVAFKQRLAIGFTTLIPILRYVAEVPYHPAQSQSLNLVSECLSNCPGIIASSSIEEISLVMKTMLKKHVDGEANMLPETFTLVCTVLVALMKSPSSYKTSSNAKSLQDSSRYTIEICLNYYGEHSGQMLHSLYLLKEAYEYSFQGSSTDSNYTGLRDCILDICETRLLPSVTMSINEIDEDIALGILELFHSILLIQSDFRPKEFVTVMVSSSWFSFSFGCLGIFPTEKMKWRVYFLLSSILDVLFGDEFGQSVRDVALDLPCDPMDSLFLLGQKGSHNQEVFCCQSAVLLILYTSSLYDDRLADDRMVLASLEQYILLNNSEIFGGVIKPLIIKVLVNLYGLYRGLAKISYQIPYSPDAENTLFHLMEQKQCEFLSVRIHMTSLKWLFQQERICKYLSNQILKWCRRCIVSNQIVACNDTETVKLKQLAELVASGDNYGAKILVCLLSELIEESRQEHDIALVLYMIAAIMLLFPAVSGQLCINGLALAIRDLYYNPSLSTDIFNLTSQLVFFILHSVILESVSDDQVWITVATELMHYLISTIAEDGCTQEALLVISILSLILHHSLHQNLIEASKTILMNTQLISLVDKTIHDACLKGPELLDHDETTQTGENLIFMLLLNYFCQKSVHVVLPGIEDTQSLLDGDISNQQSLSYISIQCHELCRLLHFGSNPVKLVSSYCLLELFQRITEQKREEPDDVTHNSHQLRSVTSVLQGQVFHSDIRVANNCARCISMAVEWEKHVDKENWYRLITEELVMILASPGLATKSIMIHHKPAVHIAVSLLKLQQVPKWMSDVFDDTCISGIIQNLSPSNITREIVLLFRELLHSGHLNSNHIACLNQLFQACRKRVYSDDIQDAEVENNKKMIGYPDDLGKVYEVLIKLISPESSPNEGLLEEIELFCQTLMESE